MQQAKAKINAPQAKTFFAFGTVNIIRVFSDDHIPAVEAAIERAFRLDDCFSAFKPGSDILRVTRNAGNGFQPVSEDTYDILLKAVQFGKASKGAFDCTVRPIVKLWGINKKGDFIPSGREIQETLCLVNYKDIVFDSKTMSIALEKPGQALDLGGIAKGYAADEIKRILVKNGVDSALINLGGNIVTVGKRPDGREWQIGIQNPLAPAGEYLGSFTVNDKTVVTSGSNERFFIKNGVRYHHIMDPRTGRPAQSSLLSVTAICGSSIDADALTTALFVLGWEKGLKLLKKFKTEAVFVTDDLTVLATPKLMNGFIPAAGKEKIRA